MFSSGLVAQTKDISGKIVASGDLVGIHIINKTASKFTITNDKGVFEIPAKLNDTIMVSGVQYKPKEVIVTDIIMQTQSMIVNLEDNVNLLDEVVVGKVLTGDLMSDIENTEVKRDINFYDVGIPGYTGPRMKQSERRLYEAKSGGGIVPLNPLINWISGRTKRLKEQIKREELNKAVDQVEAKFSEMLFDTDTLDATKRKEFFYFSGDDPKFLPLSKTKDEIKMLEFLKEKLKKFKRRLEKD
ncbi:carboxypeptidase-like regulatory domain-containing protein [Psychroserpens luteolus]|uniref:carboxypeptidase-like regulatory domain-containing protein n=1 Tax=Psychroserpens luteolus TaxID=2855840 RepID=UPI001E6489C9|nr:carboxypeptidase-like regulatory domain-containing protein [Psychroserpens luteolus]MCD2260297.1 carboxypeptidase-like regulatory domain-containing protein [Psychroserpens luteolus]